MSKLQSILAEISDCCLTFQAQKNCAKLLAVTKNQAVGPISELLQAGQRKFGENKVQEASSKWPALKKQYQGVELHLIGHLQSNKVKTAVELFDVIQTLDSIKLAEKLQAEEQKQHKKLTYCVEINIGKEPQKTGILPEDFEKFYCYLINNTQLNIQGIMCIPPRDIDSTPFFQQMQFIAHQYQLPIISMGMSDDYLDAIKLGSTLVRIGRALF